MITSYSSTVDKANAPLWQHIYVLSSEFFQDFKEIIGTFSFWAWMLSCWLFCFFTFPITVTVVAYCKKRSAQKQVREWEERMRKQ